MMVYINGSGEILVNQVYVTDVEPLLTKDMSGLTKVVNTNETSQIGYVFVSHVIKNMI